MPLILRPYQEEIKSDVYDAWAAGHKNVLMVMPTGGGKTKTFCSITIDKAIVPILQESKMPTAIMVHRKELVQQISLTLAEEGIIHNIIAPRPVIRGIVAAQRRLLNKQFYDYNAPVTVLSVDTLNSRILDHQKWAKSIKLWITDEAHHVLKNNKWGRATEYFPNAIGLGVTATPERLDKKGLGRHADGVFDTMVLGPSTKWMIANGFLCNYKVAIPGSDYQNYLKKASEGSDYSKKAMIAASKQSKIVGDVVKEYKKHALGKQGIVFTTDIDTGRKMEIEFNDQGVPAKFLSSESTDKERLDGQIAFRDNKINVLINVDLFDEGYDVPGIEVVSMARPTMSHGKFRQMVGRGLRVMKGKKHLILIDHVGNIIKSSGEVNHGLPDDPRQWTLDRLSKRRDKINYIRICANVECNSPYDRILSECPWCGEAPPIANREGGGGRVGPEQVDGDLQLLDPETLRSLNQVSVLEDPGLLAERVGKSKGGAPAAIRAMRNQEARIATQKELVQVIAKWAGLQKRCGYGDRAIHKKFYIEHGMTITQALGEPRAAMINTMEQLQGEL